MTIQTIEWYDNGRYVRVDPAMPLRPFMYATGIEPPRYPLPATNDLFLQVHMPWFLHVMKQRLRNAMKR